MKNIEKAFKLVCDYLAQKPDNFFEKSKCPYTVFNYCIIPKEQHYKNGISYIICDDIRSDCWQKYWLEQVDK